MLINPLLLAALGSVAVRATTFVPDIATFLKDSSTTLYPPLKDISLEIYHDPEVGLDESHAHDLIVDHFSKVDNKRWKVTPHAYGLPTAFTAVFEHRPASYKGKDLPVIGVLAEYDALVGIGHACGHNLIALNGMVVATLVSEALKKYDLPGRVKLVGCPDEENAAGKFTLNNAGAFDDSDIWIMAHPSLSSALQPMNSRLNYFASFTGKTHQEAVRKAYEALVIVDGLSGKLPGTASSAATIANVGVYATNVVQSFIALGVSGSSLDKVKQTVDSILNANFPGVSYTAENDADGVAIKINGLGGHGSENTKGPLVLSVETFRALSTDAGVSFYLPGNTSTHELDITIDMRSRYTADLPAVADAVSKALGTRPDNVSHDVKYPALELVPYLPDEFLKLAQSPVYNLKDFKISTFAPASTDASWIQGAVVDPQTHALLSVKKVVLHINYNICATGPGAICAFNHEPLFQKVAGTDFAYAQTETVARAGAQMAVELLADPAKYNKATAIIKK